MEESYEPHAHRWRIEEANGPKSQGVCQTCGEVREFKNYEDDWTFKMDAQYGPTGVFRSYQRKDAWL